MASSRGLRVVLHTRCAYKGRVSRLRLPRVVIVGGGFAGLEAAKALRGAEIQVVVVDRQNHHLFQPLLYQVAMAGLSPADIAIPIRAVLRHQPNAEVLLGQVTGVDLERQRVILDRPWGAPSELTYDYLFLAAGARTNYFGNDDWQEHCLGMKSLGEAVHVRRRVLMAFETAERSRAAGRRSDDLTFVVVGGGPTGVELAGALSELSRFALSEDFRHIDPGAAKVILVEAQSRLLTGGFSERLSRRAEEHLKELGVDVRLDTRVEAISESHVVVGGQRVEAAAVLWAAGVRGPKLAERLEVERDSSGRVVVDDTCRLPGHSTVFVLGDMACFRETEEGPALPGIAPVAIQQGRYAARAILALAAGKQPRSFRYRDKGLMATIGRSRAVTELGRFRLSGWIAWLAWLVIHIWYLIGFRNRVVVLVQWFWSYVTYRRGARLITDDIREAPEALASRPPKAEDSVKTDSKRSEFPGNKHVR